MSHEAFTWALRQRVSPALRFVLSIMADRANGQGLCFPGYQDISRLTGYPQRTVRRCVAELIAGGLVERRQRFTGAGRQTSNVYKLHLDRGVTLVEIAYSEALHRSKSRALGDLFSAEHDEIGEGVTVSPSPLAAVEPVDNSEDKEGGRGTEDPPQGVTVSPPEGDRGSPLESLINQDPVINPGTDLKQEIVDNFSGAGAEKSAYGASPGGLDYKAFGPSGPQYRCTAAGAAGDEAIGPGGPVYLSTAPETEDAPNDDTRDEDVDALDGKTGLQGAGLQAERDCQWLDIPAFLRRGND